MLTGSHYFVPTFGSKSLSGMVAQERSGCQAAASQTPSLSLAPSSLLGKRWKLRAGPVGLVEQEQFGVQNCALLLL